MSLLLLRDCNSGVCTVAHQGSLSDHEVVHRSDSLLVLDSISWFCLLFIACSELNLLY